MAFKKAKPEQAKLKLALYGTQGTGKTLTALMIAEGLAKKDGKRVAFLDTEHGTDFYAKAIPERTVHPEAFDFDADYTRSITDALTDAKEIDPNIHGVVVLDSMTHLWEATLNAYSGKRMANGQIPIQAWGPLKRPYKQLMAALLDGQFHVIICGRQSLQMEKDEDGDMEVVGTKMKAEGETGYEPHLLCQMRQKRDEDGTFKIQMFVEKDRSGILTGKTIDWPTFATFEPVVAHLSGTVQAKSGNIEDASERDAENIAKQAESEHAERTALVTEIRNAINGAQDVVALRAAWDLTKGKKKKLGEEALSELETLKDVSKARILAEVA